MYEIQKHECGILNCRWLFGSDVKERSVISSRQIVESVGRKFTRYNYYSFRIVMMMIMMMMMMMIMLTMMMIMMIMTTEKKRTKLIMGMMMRMK